MTSPTDLLIIPLSQSCVMMKATMWTRSWAAAAPPASQKFYFMPGTHQNMGKLVGLSHHRHEGSLVLAAALARS